MQDESSLYAYWQCGLQYQMLQSLTAIQIKQYGRRISKHEFETGKLLQQQSIEELTASGSLIAVVAFNAACVLLVDLQASGVFNVIKHLALPIFLTHGSELNLENLENFMVIEPPQWIDTTGVISWDQQLGYATELLTSIDSSWPDKVWDHAIVFSVAQLCPPVQMDISLLNQPNKVTVIEAKRNSGKSTYAQKLVIDAWIDAAIRCAPPPKYVWHEYARPLRYATIFSCHKAVDTSQHSTTDAHSEFMSMYKLYTQGKQAVENWNDISNKIKSKYAERGDIYTRLNQLHSNIKDAKVQLRHLQVLHSIWVRQIELLAKWGKFFDFIPLLQTKRLQRLHLFFKQNFPDQDTTNYSQLQFEQLFEEKMRRVENSERFVADALHQTENDLQQENLIRDKCLNWCFNQNLVTNNIAEIQTFVTEILWQKLVTALAIYWQEYFVMQTAELQIFNDPPQTIDLLIVEHAEYVSPMQAAQWLSISKRLIVMGNYAPMCTPRFNVQIDYELTKHYALASCDADFEDLQFDGKLASLGNMWNLTTQGNEADEILPCPGNINSITYSYFNTIEPGATQATLEWLQNNADSSKKIAIYTCFTANVISLRSALEGTRFADIPIRLIQEPCFDKTAISLFVPVYTSEDSGPYIFDRGAEIIDNLLANTTQHLVVVGDMSIFKPELHSASGKLAKHLLLQEEEVTCV